MTIFVDKSGGTVTSSRIASMRLYGFRMWNLSGTLIDLIPVRSGNIGYVYDRVSRSLFGNQGTGNFVLGQDIPGVTTMKKHFDYTADVTFDSTGGSACPSATYTLGKTYGELPTPTKSSYTFDGWYAEIPDDMPRLISFSNNGTTTDSCFKCALPPGYSPVGTTMTFWGKNLGRTSEMTSDEDASFFFKIGNDSNGVGLSWQHNSNSTRFSLLEEAVTWNNATVSGLDSWHHYAVVYNSQSNIVVYVDGV